MLKVRVNQPNMVMIARDSYLYSQKKTNSTQTNDPQSAKPISPGSNLGEIR